MTILMVLHNEADYVEISLQSIRMYADVENLSVVIVDNHSEDALPEWAKDQKDITYVYIDERELPFGQVVNEVCRTVPIEGDLLIMDEIVRMFRTGGYEIKEIVMVVSDVSKEQESLIDRLQEISKDTPRFMYEAFQYGISVKRISGELL